MVHTLGIGELPDVIYGETALVNKERHFLRMRRLSAPEVLTWKSFKQGMLVCHQAFFAKRSLAIPYDMQYRFSADFVTQHAPHAYRLSGRRHDHAESESLPTGTLPHHGETLRAGKYRGTSYMVCIADDIKEVKLKVSLTLST